MLLIASCDIKLTKVSLIQETERQKHNKKSILYYSNTS